MKSANNMKKLIAGVSVIVIATCLVYIPAIQSGFIWDDDTFLTNNPLIKADDGLYRFWFTTEAPDYFPLTSSMLWLEWRLWGMNPMGYHVINVLLHAVSAVLIWLILKALNIPGAWLAGLIFAVHPVNAESVAWITERKNTLPMVFYLLTLLLYLKFEDRGRRRLYWLAVFMFVLGLLAKTSVVMLPVVLLGCAWWRRRQISFTDIFRSIPFFGLSGILSFATIWFQYNRAIAGDIVRADSFFSRLAGAGWAVWFYLYKALIPKDLCFVYPRWEIDAGAVISYIPLILLAGLMILFWYYRNRWGRPFLFALGYFVVTLFPVLGFFNIYFMRFSLVADHWQYTSIIGIIALGVGLGAYGYNTWKKSFRPLFIIAGTVIAGLFSFSTWNQAHIYQNEETLWLDTIAKNPGANLAQINLGVIRKRQGRLEEAGRHFSQVLKDNPNDVEAHYNMGVILEKQNRLDEAAAHYTEVLRNRPGDADSHNNLGDIRQRQGDFDEALKHYADALRFRPSDGELHNKIGIILGRQGNSGDALKHFSEAVRLAPDNAEAQFNIGFTLEQQGNLNGAADAYAKTLQINPDFEKAHYNLGILLARQGGADGAVRHFSEILRINPDNEKAHYSLGVSFARQGKPDDAIRHFSQAVRIQPDYLKAHYSLGILWEQQGNIEKAIHHFSEALRIQPNFEEARQKIGRLKNGN
jgi:tetratricopeptide (TPR) repeat protein